MSTLFLFLSVIISIICGLIAPNTPNMKIHPFIRTVCGIWLFILIILGTGLVIFSIEGYYMHPNDNKPPKYQIVEERLYRMVPDSPTH